LLDDPALDYEGNVERRIKALTTVLDSGNYAGGPLQILVHDLLAVAFEEAGIIAAARSDESGAIERIKNAIDHLHAALRTATDRTVVNRPDIEFFDNDFRFRAAVLQLLIGDEDWKMSVDGILGSSETWNESRDLDHIYVRSFIRWPPQDVYISGAKQGAVGTAAPLNAFFNPGQIALHLCGWEGAAGSIWTKAQALNGYLSTFVNRDYRVYIKSSRRADELRQLADDYGALMKDKWPEVKSTIEKAPPGVPDGRAAWRVAVERGAQRCGVAPDKRAKIYADFEARIRGTWETSDTARRKTHGIYVGGFLSRSEADQLVIELQKLLGLKEEPYVARPKING
jgi:hypothetical protein